ncbi:MAG: hypothetical protein ABI459_09175, partial [Deltaproteobacteria bacterium]
EDNWILAFLKRWYSFLYSGAVWAILAALAALHHPISGPIGRRIMRLSVAVLLLSQTASPILFFFAKVQVTTTPSLVLTGFEMANPFFVIIGCLALLNLLGTFLVAPFVPRHSEIREKSRVDDFAPMKSQ